MHTSASKQSLAGLCAPGLITLDTCLYRIDTLTTAHHTHNDSDELKPITFYNLPIPSYGRKMAQWHTIPKRIHNDSDKLNTHHFLQLTNSKSR